MRHLRIPQHLRGMPRARLRLHGRLPRGRAVLPLHAEGPAASGLGVGSATAAGFAPGPIFMTGSPERYLRPMPAASLPSGIFMRIASSLEDRPPSGYPILDERTKCGEGIRLEALVAGDGGRSAAARGAAWLGLADHSGLALRDPRFDAPGPGVPLGPATTGMVQIPPPQKNSTGLIPTVSADWLAINPRRNYEKNNGNSRQHKAARPLSL